jgi:predicted metal-dependent TIM-barrel fold hydrolase
MLAQKNQRILELEARQVEIRHNQLKVVGQLQERNIEPEEEALLREQLELLSKLEVPIHMLLAKYKGKEREEKQRKTSHRQIRRVR